MARSIGLNMQHRQAQSLKQAQRLIMSPQMQQAIQLLQLPIMEINAIIATEMNQNPVLEYSEELGEDTPSEPEEPKEVTFDEENFEVLKHLAEEYEDHFAESGNFFTRRTAEEERLKTFLETSVRDANSLFDLLMDQAKDTFPTDQELHIAKLIIGNLSDNGFFEMSIEEMALLADLPLELSQEVLEQIQKFDPPGIAARSLQDSLLVQLERKGLKPTLAYEIIQHCFEDLLHNRIPAIRETLETTSKDITYAVETHIVPLDLKPGADVVEHSTQYVVPDVTIKKEGNQLSAFINDDRLPSLRLNTRYLKMIDDPTLPEETREYIKQKLMSGKWLQKSLHQRNDTVQRIADYLIENQTAFFLEPDGKLNPLTMKQVAQTLGIHESTVARAVANKYIDSPRGVLPLRGFFTNAYATDQGQIISSNTVKDKVREIIETENKGSPLSDEAISTLVKNSGVKCARRTVAKYRKEMNIGNAAQRKIYE